MGATQQSTQRDTGARHWADVVAIVTGVVLLGLAIWPGSPSASVGAAREAGYLPLLWMSHAFAGMLAIASVLIAQRWRRRPIARVLLVLAALALVVMLLAFRDFGPRALLTVLLPALLLLAAASSVGPMPREL